jgi:hypothetical protein
MSPAPWLSELAAQSMNSRTVYADQRPSLPAGSHVCLGGGDGGRWAPGTTWTDIAVTAAAAVGGTAALVGIARRGVRLFASSSR